MPSFAEFNEDLGEKVMKNRGDPWAAFQDTAGEVGTKIQDSAMMNFVESWLSGLDNLFKSFMTTWLDVNPVISMTGDTMAWATQLTGSITVILVTIGLIITGIRVMYFCRGEDLRVAAENLGRVVAISAGGAYIVALAIPAMDLLAQWIIDASSTNYEETGLNATVLVTHFGSLALIIGLLGALAVLVQWILMLVRSLVLPILVMFWPISESINMVNNEPKFSKVGRWVIAFLAFKPVVAIIYSFAFKLMQGTDGVAAGMSGIMTIAVAVVALPAILKVISPQATAAGASGGGAEIASAATTAATVAAIAATGGAAAGAAGAGADAGAGAGSGAAAGEGAAAGGGAGAGAEVDTGSSLGQSGWGVGDSSGGGGGGGTGSGAGGSSSSEAENTSGSDSATDQPSLGETENREGAGGANAPTEEQTSPSKPLGEEGSTSSTDTAAESPTTGGETPSTDKADVEDAGAQGQSSDSGGSRNYMDMFRMIQDTMRSSPDLGDQFMDERGLDER
ncbi:hypothetical protein NBM05_03825 [Rothia sp. AR01]|uniref:Uncharacterized protein n=1 Tax=Rothia santali TaxID=2949643 RepID=A0A9X2HE58_9MICC|nr:hypothetical protein [Rothia santali]MCP3425177.1 hypothetical protein [Rothia santali]